ncbi:Transposon TX1 uncharacterized protein [Glycine soja]
MGKNKGRQSHSVAKQIMVKGTTSSSDKSQTYATSGLAGCLDVVQANQNAYTASQDNLVGKVLVKKAGTCSAKTDDVTHQVFDNLSKCSAESESSPEVSCTLGDNDSTTDDDSSHSCGSKSSPQLDDNKAPTPWVNLFKDNRNPSKGFGMKLSPPPSDDEVLLEEIDLQPLEEAWGHSLIGYVAGRFPGKKALLDCCQKWGVKFSYLAHKSGWLVMLTFFDFGNEELSKIPVWVKLRNLPLELWNPQALGKILSKIGSPIRSDHLIASKGSISFARALVEVDTSLELIDEVRFRLPTGKTFVQKIEHEKRPSFCTHCKMIGHHLTNCKTITANKYALIAASPTLDQPQLGDSAMPHIPIQQTPLIIQRLKHVLVANHVPVLHNSSTSKKQETLSLVKTKHQKKGKKVQLIKSIRTEDMHADVQRGRNHKAVTREFSNISNRVELAEAEYNRQTIMLRKAESMKFAQLIKNRYLLQADKCSKFFHALIKRNRHSRFIAAIRLEDGHNTSSQDEIALAFVNHFRNLFSAHELTQTPSILIYNRGPKVPTDCFAALLCPTSKQEVWNIISMMDNNKAPGLDGFNALFFKKAWNIIGDDIFEAVNEFFTTGNFLKQINHAIIAFIPKHDQASQVNHFRLISCCNLLYKIVSKILANRIAPVLETIIGKTQTAFIKNRKMMDNIFLVQEILHKYARKRSSLRCLLKIDLHKAYDSISWEFLDWMLKSIGFPAQLCTWIMECVSSTSFSVAVNGSIYGHFKGQRDLRQGDPLSPYLFVLYLEYFSRDMSSLKDDANFKFHPNCVGIQLSHLAFVDDIMLLSRGDIPSVSTMFAKLQHFCRVSGLSISSDKSAIYSVGIRPHELSHI